jgi:transposase
VRWARRGIWETLFRELAGNGRSADTQMIDSTHVKAQRAEKGGAEAGRPDVSMVYINPDGYHDCPT